MTAGARIREAAVFPIILAAGSSHGLPFPKALAPFGGKTALERALETCHNTPGLARPIVVLGCEAGRVHAALRHGSRALGMRVTVVRNARWKGGQLSSLLAGLRRMPRSASGFLVYPVDHPLLTPHLVKGLLRAFTIRRKEQHIVAPCVGARTGHPIVIARQLAAEFRATARQGGTSRDVIYHATELGRVLRVPVRDAAIFRDFDSLASYRRCVRLLRRRPGGLQSARV